MKATYLCENFRTIFLGIALCFVACSLSSCVTMPTQQEISNADYGTYPNNYQEIIKHYMDDLLFDPFSAVYSNWQGPAQGYSSGFTQTIFGYRVCVGINAKNRVGGYVGRKLHYFIINNGRIVLEFDESGSFIQQLCNFL